MADEWTVETIRLHFMAIQEATEKRNDQRFTDMQTALQAALAAAKEAVVKAEVATEKRFEAVNEFRSLVNDLVAGKIDRTEFALAMKSVTERQEELKDRVTRSEGKGAGLNAGWLILAAALPVIVGVIMLVVTLSRT